MQVKKAVITAAGRGVHLFPAADTVQKGMLPLVDRDGISKPVIQIIAEEALDSGIEEVCVVCAPGDEEGYLRGFKLLRANLIEAFKGIDWAQEQAERIDNLVKRLHFAVQEEPLGYGHSVYCSRDFIGDEPFLLLLGDHLYISDQKEKRCAQQLLEVVASEDCAVAAVQATREHLIGHYGTIYGKRHSDGPGLYQIEKIAEKPSLSLAELELQMAGLRAGHYLCFFGMHVLTSRVFDVLEEQISVAQANGGEVQLTPTLQELAETEQYLALEVNGRRYDIGAKRGMYRTQLALGLAGVQREKILSDMVELLAEVKRES